jgi:hypothetical protein
MRPNNINTFRTERNIYFRLGRKGFHDIHISCNYDITSSVYSYRENYETIYFVFHLIITQYYKNRRVM